MTAAQSALLAGQMQSALLLALADDGDGGVRITPDEAAKVRASAAALIDVAHRVLDSLPRVQVSGVGAK